MKKRSKWLFSWIGLLVVLTLLPSVFAMAAQENAAVAEQSGDQITFNGITVEVVDGEAWVTRVDPSCMGLLRIPLAIGDYPITTIKSSAFQNCNEIIDVEIGEFVTVIEDKAFYRCAKLNHVSIPDSVTTIGDMAFFGCGAIQSLRMGSGVKTVGANAFCGCEQLQEIYITDLDAFQHIEFEAGITNPMYYGANLYLNDCLYTGLYLPAQATEIVNDHYRYNRVMTTAIIPEGVTSIGANAFGDCINLTTVVIPDSVTTIASSAFSGCKNLTSVIIGNGITKIGGSVFSRCSNLTSIVIPEGVTSIDSGAFQNCTALSTVTIPTTLKTVMPAAFSGCEGLTGVYMSDLEAWCEIDFIGYNANPLVKAHNLYLNNTLVEELVLPEGLTQIKARAFEGGSCITAVSIPSGVTSIGESAFWGCKKLTSVTIPDGVTSLGDTAFAQCDQLTSVTIPPSVVWAGRSVFGSCPELDDVHIMDLEAWCQINFTYPESNPMYYASKLYVNDILLTDLVIPEGVTEIKQYAFYGNNLLKTVTLPPSVTSVGEDAFGNCSKLNAVYITDLTAWCKIVFATPASNPTFHAHHLYLNGTLLTDLVIPEDILQVQRYAFVGCNQLTTVTVHPGVYWMREDAFSECVGLKAVYITDLKAWCWIDFENEEANPTFWGYHLYLNDTLLTDLVIPDVSLIKENTFINCKDLTTVDTGNQITTIGTNAFSGCSNLTEVFLSSRITSIGEDAFWECDNIQKVHITDLDAWYRIQFGNAHANPMGKMSNLFLNGILVTEYIIPEGTTMIYPYMFSDTLSLVRITIPDSVTNIGMYAFQGCTNLREIEFGNGLTFIDDYAFERCTSLTSATLPDSVDYIGKAAFNNCETLSSISLPKGLERLEQGVFARCTNLTSITIPDSVIAIDDSAFYGCTGLSTIVIPDSVATIGRSAFAHCSNLDEISIPDSVTGVGDRAFDRCEGIEYAQYENGVYLGNEHNPWRVLIATVDKSVTEFTIHPQTKVIGGNAFIHCTGLKDITIPVGVTHIGDGAFQHCTALRRVTMSDGITHIGADAFYRCTGLTGLDIPGTVEVIDDWAFANCTGLISLPLPEKLTKIGSSAFYGCTSLGTVTIPAGVTVIEYGAFAECTGLYSISFLGSKPLFDTDNKLKSDTFLNVTAEATYPWGDDSWYGQKETYGGNITWVQWDPALVRPTIDLEYPTASFEDEIIMNVYFTATNPENVTQMGLLTYEQNPSQPHVYTADTITPGYRLEDQEKGLYMVSSQGIAAKNMGKILYMVVYAQLTNGSYVYSPVVSYSPSAYANTLLTTGSDEMKALMAATLNYGHAAQAYFAVEGSIAEPDLNLIDAYHSGMVNPVVQPDSSKTSGFVSTGGFTRGYPTVSFEGALSINYYFRPANKVSSGMRLYYWTADDYANAEELTVDNATGVLRMKVSSDRSYHAAVTGIAAKDLDKTVYVACVYSDGETEYCSGVVAYSIGAYCVAQAEKTGTLAEFAAATAVYGYYAKRCFG